MNCKFVIYGIEVANFDHLKKKSSEGRCLSELKYCKFKSMCYSTQITLITSLIVGLCILTKYNPFCGKSSNDISCLILF